MNFDSTANLTLDNLKSTLTSVDSNANTVELMVHPGYTNQTVDGGCGIGPDEFSKDLGRQWELEFLVSDEWKEYLRAKDWVVTSWER